MSTDGAWHHAAMYDEGGQPDEPEDRDRALDHSGGSESPDLKRLVDSSRLYTPVLHSFQDIARVQSRRLGEVIAASAAARLGPVVPRVVVAPPLIQVNPVTDALRRQIADLTGFNDMVRQIVQPLVAAYRPPYWHRLFSSLDVLRRLYPENLRDVMPNLDVMERILVDEGIPLMWVPGPQTVRALLTTPDAVTRRRIIGQRWKGIVNDCEAVLESVRYPGVHDARGFALDAVNALRAGHTSAAQALAANLLDSVLQRHFDDAMRVQLTKNDFKTKGIKFKLDDYKFKVACTFAPVWYAHAKYYPQKGDPIPRTFGRHPSAHGVSRTQYSRINTVYAVMLVTSVIKFFDTELSRRP
ncbi:hypothetical protein GTY54_22140 [Streptomyces sp. SID625]|nr:hypothetical protein [Streptomyces sp. SID625]